MQKYLMCLRLHVAVLVPLSDPRAKAKASERQGKARHLLYLVSEIDVAPRGDQLLHRVRFPAIRRCVERRFSSVSPAILLESGGGGGGERVWWIYIYYRYIYIYSSQVFSSDILLYHNSNTNNNG